MSVSSASKYANLYADQAVLAIPCGGYGTVGIQLGGTWTGTITFEGTVNDGVWQTINVVKTNSTTQVTSATANGVWSGPCAGLLAVRARFSTYGSGSAEVYLLVSGTGGGSGSSGGGGGGGTSSDFGNAFPAAGTAAGFLDPGGNMAPAEVNADGELLVSGTFSIGGVGATGSPVPADALYVGAEDDTGDLVGLKSVARDLNSTTPPVVAVHGFYHALPGAGGPVVGGTSTAPVRVDPTGTTTQPVSAASLPLPTGAATLAEQQSQTTALQIIDDWDESDRAKVNPIVGQAGVAAGAGAVGATVQRVVLATDTTVPNVTGNVAHDAADSGNPVKVGAVAFSPDGTTPGTAVTEGDRSNAKSDLDGRLLTNPYHPTTKTVHLDGSSAYTDQALIADPGDGFQTVITNIIASTGAATALNFFLEEGSTKIFGPIYLEAVAGRGFCSGPIYLPCTASTAVTLTSSAAIAQSFQVQYFTQAV